MRVFCGIDLGSTTTKAVLLDDNAQILGRGITNSRSNYFLAADIAKDEAYIGARFTLIDRELSRISDGESKTAGFRKRLLAQFRKQQLLSQLFSLRDKTLEESASGRYAEVEKELSARLSQIFASMEEGIRRPRLNAGKKSDFFRDQAASDYSRLAESAADEAVPFDLLMSLFDKTIILVENERMDLTFEGNIRSALGSCMEGESEAQKGAYSDAVTRAAAVPLQEVRSIGTGYGRQRLPFPKDMIRSEILCHGLGAHITFPNTATVLDIGGQDTKAIQVDSRGIVTSFQMNDRCAAGCGRYLGYIADEMNLGVHELGPMAMSSTRHVKINSTCTVFAGAELRDRLTMGQRREDILAGLHRAIILRAMALLARSGGVFDEFTFTGGVANNQAAVSALRKLVQENYGERKLNISPDSIYTGALGAAHFALRAENEAQQETGAASFAQAGVQA
ncbi:MAG TPA: BadF/BadG/BcrA/BcrD ATPase family protein [Pseudomonadota bacterium]|jgi:benzoyl-CoA reductase subunit A|nr:BadF/BadG/BcrA/BcrD ATPase family protein [Pseudomonadota bacterium]